MKKHMLTIILGLLASLFAYQYIIVKHEALFHETMNYEGREYSDLECELTWYKTSIWVSPSLYIPFSHF